jgi:hypothetical protein
MSLLLGGTGVVFVTISDFNQKPILFLTGILLLIGMSAAIGRIIIELVSAGAGTLLLSGNRKRMPPPVYSIPEAKRLKGDFKGALRLYREITGAHPGEIRAWLAMLEIACENLGDRQRATGILNEGLALLVDEKSKMLLQRSYDEGMDGLRKRRL